MPRARPHSTASHGTGLARHRPAPCRPASDQRPQEPRPDRRAPPSAARGAARAGARRLLLAVRAGQPDAGLPLLGVAAAAQQLEAARADLAARVRDALRTHGQHAAPPRAHNRQLLGQPRAQRHERHALRAPARAGHRRSVGLPSEPGGHPGSLGAPQRCMRGSRSAAPGRPTGSSQDTGGDPLEAACAARNDGPQGRACEHGRLDLTPNKRYAERARTTIPPGRDTGRAHLRLDDADVDRAALAAAAAAGLAGAPEQAPCAARQHALAALAGGVRRGAGGGALRRRRRPRRDPEPRAR